MTLPLNPYTPMSHKNPLRIGFLGTGNMARIHATALRKIPGITLAGVVGSSPAKAAAFAEENGLESGYANFDAMLDVAKLDAVYLCVPPHAHTGQAELAATKGLHLFMEKPIALDVAKAQNIVNAIARAGVCSQVGFHFRFLKSVQKIRELIDEGKAGGPTLFTGRFWVNMEGPEWWRDRSRSGGQIFEQATHLHDLARHFCGEVAHARAEVRNLLHTSDPGYTIEDTSLTTIAFQNGALGIVTASNCALRDHFIADFSLVCEHLTIEFKSTGQNWVTPDSARIHYATGEVEAIVEDGDPFLAENEDFITAIREGRPTRTPATEGLAAIRLVEEALKQS